MFSDSFSYWLFNFAVLVIWLVVSITSGAYFIAIGAFIYIAFAVLIDLSGTSTEQGSADDHEKGPLDFLK